MKNAKSKCAKMQSILAIALVAVIGFSMAACGDDNGSGGPGAGGGGSTTGDTTGGTGGTGGGSGGGGTLTIINIPSETKWGEELNGKSTSISFWSTDPGDYIIYSKTSTISNGRLVLPMYKMDGTNFKESRYSGNDTAYSGVMDIDGLSSSTWRISQVTFKNGSATIDWEDGYGNL